MQPKISILVPCFNVENYLSACLDSILNQTFSDFELICIDDCSTDSTAEQLRCYQEKLAGRMKIITHSANRGLGAARNSGLAAAKCEWIASVDSDDWIDPVMMEQLYEMAVRSDADIVNTGYKQVSSEGVVEAEYGYPERIHQLSPGDDLFTLCWPAFWNKLWRRSLFIEHGISFPETFYEDLATTPRVLSNAKTIAFVPGTPYNYRQRLGSITFSASFRHISDYVSVFGVLERYFSTRLSSDPKARLQFCEMVEAHIKYHVENGGALSTKHAYADVAYLTVLGYISYVARTYGAIDRELPFFQGCYPSSSSEAGLAERQFVPSGQGTISQATLVRLSPTDAMDSMKRFNFGELSLQPIATDWGSRRGGPIDRYYIDRFIHENRHYIHEKVLEVGGDEYTKRYGENVRIIDILDINEKNSNATIIDNLETGRRLHDDHYDCIILTQVLPLVKRPLKALNTISRILKVGGTALITVPGISHISHYKHEEDNWYWSFYPKALYTLLVRAGFSAQNIAIESHGNLITTTAFLAGLGQSDLSESDFKLNDTHYPLSVTAKVVK